MFEPTLLEMNFSFNKYVVTTVARLVISLHSTTILFQFNYLINSLEC